MSHPLLARLTARAVSLTYGRYVMASLVSLGLDIGVFLMLLHLGLPAMAASALAYSAGLVAHWLLSTRFVFDEGMESSGTGRARQKGLFIVTGLIGLCITATVVGAADALTLDPRLAKIFAVAISFQATYLARRATIFSA